MACPPTRLISWQSANSRDVTYTDVCMWGEEGRREESERSLWLDDYLHMTSTWAGTRITDDTCFPLSASSAMVISSQACVCVGPLHVGGGESRGNQPWYIDTTTHPWSNTSLQSRATAMTQSTIKRGPSDTLVCKKCTRVEARELSSISADSWSLRLSPNCPAHHSAHTLQRKKRGCVLMVMPDTHVQAPCNRATHVD